MEKGLNEPFAGLFLFGTLQKGGKAKVERKDDGLVITTKAR
jgi:hypothetical protein